MVQCKIFVTKCDALRDLILFVQFKKREKHPWRSVNFSKVAGWSLINAPQRTTNTWLLQPFKHTTCISCWNEVETVVGCFWCFQGVEKGCIENEWVKQQGRISSLAHFSPTFHFYTTCEFPEFGFLTFSGGVEIEHWAKMTYIFEPLFFGATLSKAILLRILVKSVQ